MTIKIDPEFEQQIPPLKPEEFEQLEKNILEDGVILNPLILWNGILVDGHNRYTISQKHPQIKFTTFEREFSDRYAAMAWIYRNQLGRRNLTLEQKRYLIGKQYAAEKLSHGGDRKSEAQKSSDQNDHLISADNTRDKIAKEHDVSPATVQRAHEFANAVDIADESSPGFREQILSGNLKPTTKEVRSIAKAKPEDRPALIEKIKHPEKKPAIKKEKPFDLMQKIADDMLETHRTGTPSDMFCELEDALDSLIFRWSMCLRTYESYYTDNKHRGKINELAEDGRLFLSQIQGGTIPE